MEVLIGRFNTMLAAVAKGFVAKGFAHVHYVDVRGALQNGPNYRQWWANELHPKNRGFDAVAKIIADNWTRSAQSSCPARSGARPRTA